MLLNDCIVFSVLLTVHQLNVRFDLKVPRLQDDGEDANWVTALEKASRKLGQLYIDW